VSVPMPLMFVPPVCICRGPRPGANPRTTIR
jgi:hypothetical protein